RPPDADERDRLATCFQKQQQMLMGNRTAVDSMFPVKIQSAQPVEMAAWVGLSRVLLNLDEFITRE
ncbi:MAG: hypothetical protein GY953_40950, partial [bacterium]|nr:hypothetical protein [bacterium]